MGDNAKILKMHPPSNPVSKLIKCFIASSAVFYALNCPAPVFSHYQQQKDRAEIVLAKLEKPVAYADANTSENINDSNEGKKKPPVIPAIGGAVALGAGIWIFFRKKNKRDLRRRRNEAELNGNENPALIEKLKTEPSRKNEIKKTVLQTPKPNAAASQKTSQELQSTKNRTAEEFDELIRHYWVRLDEIMDRYDRAKTRVEIETHIIADELVLLNEIKEKDPSLKLHGLLKQNMQTCTWLRNKAMWRITKEDNERI